MERASVIVSGNLEPVVSGNAKAHIPANTATEPITVMGKGFQYLPKGAIAREITPPTRAIVLQVPTAVPRKDVG